MSLAPFPDIPAPKTALLMPDQLFGRCGCVRWCTVSVSGLSCLISLFALLSCILYNFAFDETLSFRAVSRSLLLNWSLGGCSHPSFLSNTSVSSPACFCQLFHMFTVPVQSLPTSSFDAFRDALTHIVSSTGGCPSLSAQRKNTPSLSPWFLGGHDGRRKAEFWQRGRNPMISHSTLSLFQWSRHVIPVMFVGDPTPSCSCLRRMRGTREK